MAEAIARSPITPAPPVVVESGWEVSARRSSSPLTLGDCTPMTKVQLRARNDGPCARALGVPFGRAARDHTRTLVIGSTPGEWLLLAAPGTGDVVRSGLESLITGMADFATLVDLTHGRALLRLTGLHAPDLLAKLCPIDLCDEATPDGTAFRTAVANLVTDVIRDDHDGSPSYLLHCERSSGQYLFDVLYDAGTEYNLDITGFHP